ncbi:MAG: NnrS family protein [Verrucomicrobiae bacterium]|nr:NnrS family protein [Verrucomicrobiae bacterium]
MRFPACKHRRRAAVPADTLRWLAAEPYRVFFALGALWSIIGVALWPLFYQGRLPYYPLFAHARIMIEGFGSAFVVGFLGTAGPRMASAPKLSPPELLWLISLHTAGSVFHLCGRHVAGDGLFAALLLSLLGSLMIRVLRFRKEVPPPQLLLALTGLLCGTAGAVILAFFEAAITDLDPRVYRLASLLLNQGLLLPPVLGIGSFVFPRILGGSFGDPSTDAEMRKKLRRTLLAIVLLIGSFLLEVFGSTVVGGLLRAAVCLIYLLLEVRWKKQAGQGTLAAGLKAALVIGLTGLVLAAFANPAQRISVEHLLYIGGFGLLMFVVGSRVLFGHSGQLAAFAQRSRTARILIGLVILAATTRALPALVPEVTVSHHQYAALTWAGLALLWLIWQRRRFLQREKVEVDTERQSNVALPTKDA